MNNASFAAQSAGLVRLLRRGAYTNDPADQNYGNHHYSEPLRAGETLEHVYPATFIAGGLKTYGTVRQTNYGTYVDPARLPQSGLIARAGNAALDNVGLNTGRRYDTSTLDIATPAPNRLALRTPDGIQVSARTDGFVGRPADLSPMEQLKNALRFAKG